MTMIQTFFCVPTGLGRVVRYRPNGDADVVGDCTRDEYRADKLRGDSWSPLYRRTDTGDVARWQDMPDGATRLDDPMAYDHAGPDGKMFRVKCPGGRSWTVDGRASNCTMPDDKAHWCWVRHGTPERCDVTVDKQGGPTCNAGAGSIQTENWHGFLTRGILSENRA